MTKSCHCMHEPGDTYPLHFMVFNKFLPTSSSFSFNLYNILFYMRKPNKYSVHLNILHKTLNNNNIYNKM